MKEINRYKINVTFSGTAALEIEASSVEEARRLASELTPTDLARTGHADVLSFKVAAREVTPITALHGQGEETSNSPSAPPSRPSGWYRPK